MVADGTHRRLVAAAGAGHNVAAVEEDARSGQLPAQEADVAVAEELHLKLWHLEEKCGKGAASTKGTSRGRRTRIWNGGNDMATDALLVATASGGGIKRKKYVMLASRC